ncbi:unnamed protein product [Dovyalis caffra]|uniref:Ribosomal protein S7 n=1 Tax=Dovyalis caffra TaxID=77055 RepID=A0AAV1RJP8_9ROSI|nr:unnamed protein product [Dovyalis caffra]
MDRLLSPDKSNSIKHPQLSKPRLFTAKRLAHTFIYTMNKVRDVPAAAIGKISRGTGKLPKRGQIKSRIAANAFHSIVSVLYKASSNQHHSQRKSYLRKA